jgi:hypothetical protein
MTIQKLNNDQLEGSIYVETGLPRECNFLGCNKGSNGKVKLYIPLHRKHFYCCNKCRIKAYETNQYIMKVQHSKDFMLEFVKRFNNGSVVINDILPK